ncbi:efflux RND transporter permease subunit [Singulisphaera acidiphila]|uniref:Heavy metal efflux pump, cobalt-zinc-cadmium n=1 Tax=Singulisphaera acidiphila (strain ATCC BAA-1392 / DSM 18658 / VKM B-2454 / MOB10) TaxID=886293 RepID=L0DS97_SINAD|nr:CusA/CzcA family heavy metal efflux RND transporter [Singulisphaera acidiphila]AGA31281.1 heavy metal efflux pump, cobalt-zinc-cadmium [Singulisphaera acidiphila DSM 18658]
MVRAIISWSLHNRLIVLLGTVLLIAVGVYSATNLNVEAYPDPTPPLVEVITQNQGWSPEEMERLIGIPLETALNGMPGLEFLRSTSVAGLNDIKCQFAYGTDYWAARQEVINRIGSVELPGGVKPELSPWSPTGEIVRYVLEGPGYTLNQLKAVQDWVLTRSLKQVPGVIDVTGFGGTVKQYQVLLDTRLLKQYGVTLQQVEEAIKNSNANVGGDTLALGTQAHNVRITGLLGSGVDPLDPAKVERAAAIESEKLDDIRRVVVATADDGTPIYVRQVAQVIVGNQPRLGLVGRDDENDVVEGIVMMRKYEKSLPTAEAVEAKLKEIEHEKLLPKGMSVRIFNQRTELVHVTTHNVIHNLVVGVVLVVGILFVFLGNLTSAAIVALMIPLALLFAVTVLYAQGKSANLLSIGAVDFGIIVDSSVIIVENVYRHLSEPETGPPRPLIERIAEASHEIERALFFSTTIIVCAFIPLFSMTGPEGALFGPMANTYAFSICGALLLAVTLVPVLCSLLFHSGMKESETVVDRVMKRRYLKTLDRVLRYRYLTLTAMGGIVVFTACLIPSLGGEFMPQLEEGNLWIRALMPRTTSLEEAARMAPRIREVVASIPEARGVMSQVGRPDDGTDITSYYNMEFNVPLKPMEEWRQRTRTVLGYPVRFAWNGRDILARTITRDEIQDELMERFKEDFPALNFNFSQLIRDNVEEALSGVKGANSVKLFGSDLDVLEEVGEKVVQVLRTVPGIDNVGLFHVIGQPNLEIQVDREACARYGINVADVEAAGQVAIGGRSFSEMVEGEKLYDIVLRLPRDLRDDPGNIAHIPIDIPGTDQRPATRIPMSHVSKILPHKPGASYIYRENNRRFVPIKFGVRGRDLASAIAEAQEKLADPTSGVKLPEGYRVEWSGEFAQMEQANRRLMLIVPLSIVLILGLLYMTFNSTKDALLVMCNVLEAAIGGILALWITGTPFSISAAVGFISIFGVAVQDGVLLISYFNQMRAGGLSVRESIMRGAELRVRPVVMTSLTAALGLLPAALATSIGSQAQKPLAIVVVGGMLCTLFLTRYLMPVLYSFFPAPRGRASEMEGTS